jgi:RHS repeat-associated protein
MDELAYSYHMGTNRLNHVDDAKSSSNYAVDVDDQSDDNYEYDEIGNLKHDEQEEIANIEWTPSGKIRRITRTPGSTKPMLEFYYGPTGDRLVKIVTNPDETVELTYYHRDAQGNTMATYNMDNTGFKLSEQYLYGSSRLGIYTRDLLLTGLAGDMHTRLKGSKQYELSNHLGNVLSTVSDRRSGVDAGSNGSIDYYAADVKSAQDYYPFGMVMVMRGMMAEYRHGFNGQERDDEVNGTPNTYTATFWEYDGRTGRRWNLDPKPITSISHYATFALNPMMYTDPQGDKLVTDGKTTSKDDLKLLAGKYADALAFSTTNNTVSLDFEKLKGNFKDKQGNFDQAAFDAFKNSALQDKGVSLLNDIIGSPKNYLYTSSYAQMAFNPQTRNFANNFLKGPKNERIATKLELLSGVTLVGEDAFISFMNVSKTPYGVSGQKDLQPADPTYDAHVNISPGEYFADKAYLPMIKIPRVSIIYHELRESFLRTDMGLPYPKAHDGSIKAEGSFYGNKQSGKIGSFIVK